MALISLSTKIGIVNIPQIAMVIIFTLLIVVLTCQLMKMHMCYILLLQIGQAIGIMCRMLLLLQ